eukprot:scaffold175_cov414-Prasinococcus_capsulatus_cf.AAC.33
MTIHTEGSGDGQRIEQGSTMYRYSPRIPFDRSDSRPKVNKESRRAPRPYFTLEEAVRATNSFSIYCRTVCPRWNPQVDTEAC